MAASQKSGSDLEKLEEWQKPVRMPRPRDHRAPGVPSALPDDEDAEEGPPREEEEGGPKAPAKT